MYMFPSTQPAIAELSSSESPKSNLFENKENQPQACSHELGLIFIISVSCWGFIIIFVVVAAIISIIIIIITAIVSIFWQIRDRQFFCVPSRTFLQPIPLGCNYLRLEKQTAWDCSALSPSWSNTTQLCLGADYPLLSFLPLYITLG